VATALLVIDVLNTYDHEDAAPLARAAQGATPAIAGLWERARAEGAEVVQVNDHHDLWHAGPQELARAAMEGERPDLVEPLLPHPETPFLVKARHSAFYETMLFHFLREREIDRVVLTGQVTEQCILYTALDAHLRRIEVCVPSDAVAGIDPGLHEAALRMIERNMHGEVCRAADVRL
jgi:nicotinamidase-related amidase